MTVFNQINNVSDDYTYIIDASEVFFDIEEIGFAFFYNAEQAFDEEEGEYGDAIGWEELSLTPEIYQNIQDKISNNKEIKPILLDNNDDFLSLDTTEPLYHGVMADQTNFPDNIPEHSYIALIQVNRSDINVFSGGLELVIGDEIGSSEEDFLYVCLPIKSLLLSSQTQIWDVNEYMPSDKEYISAKLLYEIVTKVMQSIQEEIQQIGNAQGQGLEIITLSVDASDLLAEGHDTSGLDLFYHFDSINQPNIRNQNAIYKIRINYDDVVGPLGSYYIGNVITRYYMYVYDGEGPQFISLGVDENDIAVMIDEKIRQYHPLEGQVP